MKKAILYFFLVTFKMMTGQDVAPFKLHSKSVSRIVNQTNSIVSGKIAEGIVSGRLTVYTDEACTQKVLPSDLKATLQKTHYFKSGQEWEGKKLTTDTAITLYFGPGWIGQYKLGPSGQLWIYIQYPLLLNTPGKWLGCIKPSDYKKLLSDMESDFLNCIGADGGVPTAQLVSFFWASFAKSSGGFWPPDLKKYKTPSFSDTLSQAEFLETYQLMAFETVVPDAAHRELDYQRSIYIPLNADSLKGFAFRCNLRKDPSGGNTVSLSPFSVSPLWDPSGTGGDPFMLEQTFWVSVGDYFKKTTTADRSRITLLMMLMVQERMYTDCTF